MSTKHSEPIIAIRNQFVSTDGRKKRTPTYSPSGKQRQNTPKIQKFCHHSSYSRFFLPYSQTTTFARTKYSWKLCQNVHCLGIRTTQKFEKKHNSSKLVVKRWCTLQRAWSWCRGFFFRIREYYQFVVFILRIWCCIVCRDKSCIHFVVSSQLLYPEYETFRFFFLNLVIKQVPKFNDSCLSCVFPLNIFFFFRPIMRNCFGSVIKGFGVEIKELWAWYVIHENFQISLMDMAWLIGWYIF